MCNKKFVSDWRAKDTHDDNGWTVIIGEGEGQDNKHVEQGVVNKLSGSGVARCVGERGQNY